jgi:acyl-CoA reductase-like NAD-dependent aldehyde dehydrogenase
LDVGRRAIVGGSRLQAVGESFFAPTVLSMPTQERRVPEIAAGPVVMIAAADGVESMSRLAAAPVAAAIMGGHFEFARALADRLDAATIQIGTLPKPHLHETLFGERALVPVPGSRYPLTQLRSVTP